MTQPPVIGKAGFRIKMYRLKPIRALSNSIQNEYLNNTREASENVLNLGSAKEVPSLSIYAVLCYLDFAQVGGFHRPRRRDFALLNKASKGEGSLFFTLSGRSSKSED